MTNLRPRGISSWPTGRRFWRNVQKSDGCWLWTGATGNNGYGLITDNGKRAYAHRVSYQLNVAAISDGQVVCHRCDVRNCVRPDHLFVGTIADNNRDMWAKGRGKGLDPHNGKLTEEQRRSAVQRVGAGESKTAVGRDLGVSRQAIHHLVKAGIYG